MKNSHDYRPLGLGYANLGALLMACGLPYDSDGGRDYAACVTAIMCGEAYLQSSRIAELCPPLAPATEPTKKGLGDTNLGSNAQLAHDARRSLPRLVHQPRTVPGCHSHAPRSRKQHQQNQRPQRALRSSQSTAGTKPSPTAKSTATATPRSRF